MVLELKNESYEISTNLGVAYEIENSYKSKINKIIENAADYRIEEMCKLMFVGVKRNNKNIKFEEFLNNVLDSDLSAVDLQKEFSVFIRLLVSSDKTEADIREEMQKAYEKIEKEENEKLEDKVEVDEKN